MPIHAPHPTAISIAGSDSGGGAGIQADLKTFAAFGVFGTTAITGVTAQNTLGVQAFELIAPDLVAEQIRSVISDMQPRAAKTGMLGDAAIVRAVAEVLRESPPMPLVIDPVMIAKSGDALLRDDAVAVLRTELVPVSTVVTPNLPEAAALVGFPVETEDDMLRAGKRLLEAGAQAVVVKGGHRSDNANDLYIDAECTEWLVAERIQTNCTHGTGCTFSAAITAGLAWGKEPFAAVVAAKEYLTAAMRAGYEVGAGQSPVNHLYAIDFVNQEEGISS